ncbi:MAG: hypothetical protein HQK50_09095 [Oligoflexia bacterium]|nr:hypothetical protein [Oligoflexia bacterium]MBF0365715.1 hypothetical protein [Oligoflexia bacterium]
MNVKEYETHIQLISACYDLLGGRVKQPNKKLAAVDKILKQLSAYEHFDFRSISLALFKAGITAGLPKITLLKSVKDKKKFPKRAPIGSYIFVEDVARYFVRGTKKWLYLPSVYVFLAKQNKNKIPVDLLLDSDYKKAK